MRPVSEAPGDSDVLLEKNGRTFLLWRCCFFLTETGEDLTAVSINVGFHYLSAYREVAAAAGARGTARDETGSARRVHTQNTFPLKRRGTEGVKKR